MFYSIIVFNNKVLGYCSKTWTLKKASVLEAQKYGILCPNKLEIANLCPYLRLISLANASLFNNNI